MAAVFPLDTTRPWTFNGVTYVYDPLEDRWSVSSTLATDELIQDLSELDERISNNSSTIVEEIDNRTELLQAAATKNNNQDAAIDELSGRIDAIGTTVGILEFKGNYKYRLERSEAACDAAYIACLNQDLGDPVNASECARLWDECKAEVGDPLPSGTFTSIDSVNQSDVEELVISNTTQEGTSFDWENLLEVGDYIEFVETTLNDTVLYEVVADPIRSGTEERIRVKYIKESADGDGDFNLEEIYELRVIKQSLGLDIVEADKRYIQKPYTVYFSESAPNDGDGQAEDGKLRNGELWFDTLELELFVWNNNAWVATAKPPSQDIVISSALDDISRISGEVNQVFQELNTIDAYLQTRKNIYYSDGTPDAGSNPDGTPRSFNNGDLWIDGNNLEIKFYSQGSWVNPDRTTDSNDDGMPIGSIIFWGGTREKIPNGWIECDGNRVSTNVEAITGRSHTPNLKNYMPAGSGGVFGSTLGNYYSSKILKHTHAVSRLEPASTTGNPDGSADTSSSAYRYWRGNSSKSGSSGQTISRSSSETGDDITAPPVYLGIYIMKVA